MGSRTLVQKDKTSGIYYFRKRIPKDLIEVIGKKELKQSLRTKDPQESRRLATLAELEVYKLFENVRNHSELSEQCLSNIRVLPSSPPVAAAPLKQAPLLSDMYQRWKKERNPAVSSIRE